MFLIMNRWKAIKTQYFAEIQRLCFSYSHWPLDTKHLLSNRRAVFWGHITTGCFEKSSEWLSATEESFLFFIRVQVEFLKIIFLSERRYVPEIQPQWAACCLRTIYCVHLLQWVLTGPFLVTYLLISYLHTYSMEQSSLRSWPVLSWPRNSPHSQQPANYTYPEPDKSSPCPATPLLEDPS